MDFIRMFNMIDTDNSGEITRSELITFMQNNNYTEDFVDKWLTLFDFNQRGRITIDDFCDRLGLVIDEDMNKHIKHHRPSFINLDNLDELDDFVDVDDKMEQHVIHVSTNKPISTPTKRNYDFHDNLDLIPEMTDLKKEVIFKKTAYPLFGMSQSTTNSLKRNSKKEHKNENSTDIQITSSTHLKKDLTNEMHNNDSGQKNQQIFRNNTMPSKSVEKSPKFSGFFSFGKSKKVKVGTLESSKTNESRKSNRKSKSGTESLDRNLDRNNNSNNSNVNDPSHDNQPSTSIDFRNEKEKEKHKRKTINSTNQVDNNNFDNIDINNKPYKHHNSFWKLFQKDKKSSKKDNDKQTKNIKESKEIKSKSNSDEKSKLKKEQKSKNNDKEKIEKIEKNKESSKEIKVNNQEKQRKHEDFNNKLNDMLRKREDYLSDNFSIYANRYRSEGHEEFEKEWDKMILEHKSLGNLKSEENVFRKTITNDEETSNEASILNMWRSLDENINEDKLNYLSNNNNKNEKSYLFKLKREQNPMINKKNLENHVSLDFFKRPSEIDYQLPENESDILEEIIIPQNVMLARNERRLTIPEENSEEKIFPSYKNNQQYNKMNETIIHSTTNNNSNKLKNQKFDNNYKLNSFDNIDKSTLNKCNVDYNLNEKLIENEIDLKNKTESRKNLEKAKENNENISNLNLSGKLNDEMKINIDNQSNLIQLTLDNKTIIIGNDLTENSVKVNNKNEIKNLVHNEIIENEINYENENKKKFPNQKFFDTKSIKNNNEDLIKNENHIKSKLSENSSEFQNKSKDKIDTEFNSNENKYKKLQNNNEHVNNQIPGEKHKNMRDEINVELNINENNSKKLQDNKRNTENNRSNDKMENIRDKTNVMFNINEGDYKKMQDSNENIENKMSNEKKDNIKDKIDIEFNINEDNSKKLKESNENLENKISNKKQKNIDENNLLNKNDFDRKPTKNFDTELNNDVAKVNNRDNKVKDEIKIIDNNKILRENNHSNKFDELANKKEKNENKNIPFSLVNQSENLILSEDLLQKPSVNEISKYIENKNIKINRNKIKIIYKDYVEKDFPNLLDDIVNIYEETKLLDDWNGHELMKNYLDKYYERIWSVIITDNSYELYVTYENMIIFNYDSLTFIIWKTFESF